MIGIADELLDFTGELLFPGGERYDAARKVWNGAIDRYPALIARARCTADVAAVIRFARERDMPLSVRGGGHSAAGLAVADGAVMLDLSAMKAAQADPGARTVVAAAGLRWDELDAATQAHGLAVTGGVVGSIGIAGLTLGGGIGRLDWLASGPPRSMSSTTIRRDGPDTRCRAAPSSRITSASRLSTSAATSAGAPVSRSN